MLIVPAVAIGFFVFFGIVYVATYAILTRFARKNRSVTTYSWGRWKEVARPDEATEKQIEKASAIAGGAAVLLMVLLLLILPREWLLATWVVLTVLGILASLLTWVIR